MPIKENILKILKEINGELSAKYHIDSLALFGSVARGDEHEDSDVDLLVEFSTTPDLLTFIELEENLKERLGFRVDLVPKRKLKAELVDRITKEAVAI